MQLDYLTEMDIIYANYEPNKGFEEKQAEIYTKAVERYDGPPVTALATMLNRLVSKDGDSHRFLTLRIFNNPQ